MRMHDLINSYEKGYVFEYYSRIVKEFKNYEKITKTKMLDEVYKVYDDSYNIIDICTTRELRYLQKVLNNKVPKNSSDYPTDKYYFEVRTLQNKFLLDSEKNIPDEVITKVKEALKEVNWTEKKQIDELNELLVAYIKVEGVILLSSACEYVSAISGVDIQTIWEHVLDNKLFNYYVFISVKDIEGVGEQLPLAVYQEFYDIQDEIEQERGKQELFGSILLNQKLAKTLFYNDFDIDNPKIKKLIDEIVQLPLNFYHSLKMIRRYAVLNKDRELLKFMLNYTNDDMKDMYLTDFYQTLDEAMDEMPSGVLYGLTPSQVKEAKAKRAKAKIEKYKNYIMQENAYLSEEDAKLFYKVYFALLEFTNKKYKINNSIKIYKQESINQLDVIDIIDKYWENKEQITSEFCKSNPFKFNEEELKLTLEFKKGIRGIFIICKFEKEYTAFFNEDKIYMVKGIDTNIDEIISYSDLPYLVITTIIPFKDNLVYDGFLPNFSIDLGDDFGEQLEKEYNSIKKYYHL